MGQYLPDRHAVVLYPALEQVVVARRLLGISISDFSETFIHEFAHHIYFQILAGHSPEHSIWDLYQWTVRQGMVRESSSPLARSRGIGRDFRGYYPNDIYRGVFGFPHSGSNDLEFFAELFTEYVNSTFNPNPAGGVFARRDLMESFLSGAEEERLRPEVFLENRLRKAYNYYGLAYAPIRWLPDFRLEAVFGSRLETGVSLFVGAKDFHPRHFFGFGVMGGVEASIPGGGLTGSLKAEFATGANLRLMIPTELAALMRLGAKTDGVSFWSSFDLGLRVTVGIPPRGHWRGFNISAGFFEEMSIQLGFSSYGTLGLGYTF